MTTDPNVGGTTINQPLSPDDFIKVLPVAGVAPVSAARAETVEDSDEADAAADVDAGPDATASPGVLTPKKKMKGKRGNRGDSGDAGSARRRNLWEQRLRRSRWERRADGADGGGDVGASGPAYPRCPATPAGLLSTVRPGARQPMANGTCAQAGGAKVPSFDFTGCCNSHDLCFGKFSLTVEYPWPTHTGTFSLLLTIALLPTYTQHFTNGRTSERSPPLSPLPYTHPDISN